MRSDARLLRKDGRCDSGSDAPERRRKQWKVARICYLNESGKCPEGEMGINIPGGFVELNRGGGNILLPP
jgi:hypothetical protein